MEDGSLPTPSEYPKHALLRRLVRTVVRNAFAGLNAVAGGHEVGLPPARTHQEDTTALGRRSAFVLAASPLEPSTTDGEPTDPTRANREHAPAVDLANSKEVSRRTNLSEQLSVGTMLGLATGYSIRKIGRILAFLVGTEIIILQYFAYKQWLVMDWQRVANDLKPKLNRSTWDAGMDIILYRLPFVTAFSAGLAAGLRISK